MLHQRPEMIQQRAGIGVHVEEDEPFPRLAAHFREIEIAA